MATRYRNLPRPADAGPRDEIRRRPRPELARVPFTPTPFVEADLEAFHAPGDDIRALWLGHSTFLVRLDGRVFLTDPVTGNVFPARRRVGEPADVEALGQVDAVLVSHNHYDHLDMGTVRRVAPRAGRVLGAEGVGAYIASKGVPATDVAWWEHEDVGGVRVYAAPACHWSRRGAFDQNRTHWCAWVMEARDGRRVYFAGDTAWSHHFAVTAERFPGGFDVALMPVGAYYPAWMFARQHINPEEAGEGARALGARHTVAMHWGTYKLTFERTDEPPRRARAWWDAQGDDAPGVLHVLPVGGMLSV